VFHVLVACISKVQGLLGPGERLWALCSASSLDALDNTGTVASGADNCEPSAPAEDVEMLPDDEGKASVWGDGHVDQNL